MTRPSSLLLCEIERELAWGRVDKRNIVSHSRSMVKLPGSEDSVFILQGRRQKIIQRGQRVFVGNSVSPEAVKHNNFAVYKSK